MRSHQRSRTADAAAATRAAHRLYDRPIVFDYAVPDALIDDSDRQAVARLRRFTARRGEPLITSFEPAALCRRAGELGHRVPENLEFGGQNRRYFEDRSDGLRTLSGSHYLHLALVEPQGPR